MIDKARGRLYEDIDGSMAIGASWKLLHLELGYRALTWSSLGKGLQRPSNRGTALLHLDSYDTLPLHQCLGNQYLEITLAMELEHGALVLNWICV